MGRRPSLREIMAQTVTLKGAEVKIYIAGKLYPEAQSITITTDYEEEETYGIDSPFAQEIATTRVKVSGRIVGIKTKDNGGTQGAAARAEIKNILSSPYTSLRVHNRYTQKDIFFLPQMKVTNETLEVATKGVAKLSFSFKGIVPFHEVDLA